jgi:hypothetical protein
MIHARVFFLVDLPSSAKLQRICALSPLQALDALPARKLPDVQDRCGVVGLRKIGSQSPTSDTSTHALATPSLIDISPICRLTSLPVKERVKAKLQERRVGHREG